MFSARDQNVLSFSHLAHYFLAIFSKVHEFVQNNVFCPTSARFVSFGLATPLFSDFQQSAQFVQNSIFCPRSECFVILALRTPLSPLGAPLSTKCTSLYKTAFSAPDQHVLSFSHWAYHFLRFSARRTSLYKAVFSHGIRTFCHFRTWLTTFKPFLAKCTSLCKTAFSERDQHVLSFSHWAHYFLATFNKVHEFLENSVFSPRSARFVIFTLGILLFTRASV